MQIVCEVSGCHGADVDERDVLAGRPALGHDPGDLGIERGDPRLHVRVARRDEIRHEHSGVRCRLQDLVDE